MVGSCDVEKLFGPNVEQYMHNPIGYVEDGYPDDLVAPKHMYWDVAPDPLGVPGCQMFLVRFLDGSPVAVRYKSQNKHEFEFPTPSKEEAHVLDCYKKAFGQR
jgi:hypothetical protein